MKNTALVYDRVNKWGGAERMLLTLHEIFPNAPLYTSLYDPENAKWANIFPNIIPSYLNKIPYLRNKHELLGTFMPITFESFNFNNYDLVISVTSEAAKGIITKPHTKHICFCLTPTRYLWSGYSEYFKSPLIRYFSKPAVSYLRRWDRIAARRPDKMIAISTEVKKRISDYYGMDSEIIFPPVELNKFISSKKKRKADDYFLIVSRLVPYKKVDLAINAFNKLGSQLVVIGTGSEEFKLKKLARKNIKFISNLKDKELSQYYRHAKALIMPQVEDFGIVAVEAQASGCPVIAYKKGGALDTVIENQTGLFFSSLTTEGLVDAVKRFDRMKFKEINLINNAQNFSEDKFKKKVLELIDKL